MIRVVPLLVPETTPDALTVAIARLALLHVPPAGVPLNVAVLPVHTDAVPVIVWALTIRVDSNNQRVSNSVRFNRFFKNSVMLITCLTLLGAPCDAYKAYARLKMLAKGQ